MGTSGKAPYTPYRKRRKANLAKRPFRRRVARMDVSLGALVVVLVLMLLAHFAPQDPGEVQTSSIQQDGASGAATPGGMDEPEEPDAGPVAKAGPPVTFLMQNVQNYFVQGEKQRSRYTLHPKKEAEREAVADTIASVRPAIVGLVEIGGPLALDDLAARLAVRGLEYPHRFVLTREGEDRALAILSQYPIVRNDSRADQPLFGAKNRKMLRGVLDVTVRVADGREFRIIGAHLKSHVGNEDETRHLRTQESRTLAKYLHDAMDKRPNLPIVVYGDWNDGPDAASLGILKQGYSKKSALTRLKPSDERGEEWTHHYKAGGEYLIYDQIYVNAPLRSRMGRKSKTGVTGAPQSSPAAGSDHRAVWCELR